MVSVGIGKVLVNLGLDSFQALGKLLLFICKLFQLLGKLVLLLGEMIDLQFQPVYPVRQVVMFHFKPIDFLGKRLMTFREQCELTVGVFYDDADKMLELFSLLGEQLFTMLGEKLFEVFSVVMVHPAHRLTLFSH